MKRTRAFRRDQADKAKRRTRRVLKTYWGYDDDWADDKRVGLLARTPCPCSCWLHGMYQTGRTPAELQAKQLDSDLEKEQAMPMR